MERRRLLVTSAASLALPSIVRAQSKRGLKFIPQSDLCCPRPNLDHRLQTRNHGYMVFDTLYGLDAASKPSPQMVGGAASPRMTGAGTLTCATVCVPRRQQSSGADCVA